MPTLGQAILTDAGFAALADAAAHGTTIQPSYFKFASSYESYVDEFGNLDGSLTAMATDVWKTQDINYYRIMNEEGNLVEFTCDVLPDDGNSSTWVCGLFIPQEDPTPDILFMLAKAPEAFPASIRQIFRIQLAFNDAGDLIDFVVNPLTSFLELVDTPDFYTGSAGKVPVVNETETALIFADAIAQHIYDIPDVSDSDYVGKAGWTLEVDSDEGGMSLVPVNDSLIERTFEDLPFLSGLLSSNPRDILIEYFDSGYSGTYSVDGVGAVAVITIDLASGTKTVELTYDEVNERLDSITITFGGEESLYTLTYSDVTESLESVSVSVTGA
jgi:hypothetical protein